MSDALQTVTMAEIAEKAGVSKATVSRALAGSSLIGPATISKVTQAADTLGYERKKTKRPGERAIFTVKLVIPPESNRTARLFYSLNDLVDGLRSGLAPAGLNLIVESNTPSFSPFPHKKSGDTEAFIFAFHRPSKAILNEILKAGTRVILLNRTARGIPSICSDHAEAMQQITSQLASRSGKFCFVSYRGIEEITRLRLRGFQSGCVDHDLSFDPEKDHWHLDHPEELSGADLKKWHAHGYQTFVCVNDVIGSLLIQHARETGLRVPKDMAVTGCDNSPIRALTIPTLTTCDLSSHALAKEAGTRLFHELVEGTSGPLETKIPGTILIGDTT